MKKAVALIAAALAGLTLCSCVSIKGTGREKLEELIAYTENDQRHYSEITAFLPEITDDVEVIFSSVDLDGEFDDRSVFARCRFLPERFDEELDRLRDLEFGPTLIDERGGVILWGSRIDEYRADFTYVKYFDDYSILYAYSRSSSFDEMRKTVPDEYWLPLLDHTAEYGDLIRRSSEEIIGILTDREKEKLGSLFSDGSVREDTDFDAESERLFEDFAGFRDSSVCYLDRVEKSGGKTAVVYSFRMQKRDSYFGESEADAFTFRWIDVYEVTEDRGDPEHVGIEAIFIEKENSNKSGLSGFLTEDENGLSSPMRKGVVFECDSEREDGIDA